VKNLYLAKKAVSHVALALQELVEGRMAEVLPTVLPTLQNIFLGGPRSSGPVQEGIGQFVAARKVAGRPVVVSRWTNSLHIAAGDGNIDVVKALLERGMDVNGRNAHDQTPLHGAAHMGNSTDVVRLLIERGAEVDSYEKSGWTALHYASRFGHLEASRVLLDHGANVNARMRDYWTPIHFSARTGNFEVVKLLLERGADVHAVNGQGRTPYQLSLEKGHRKIADLLREHDVDRERFEIVL
jgi:hypothetical protein